MNFQILTVKTHIIFNDALTNHMFYLWRSHWSLESLIAMKYRKNNTEIKVCMVWMYLCFIRNVFNWTAKLRKFYFYFTVILESWRCPICLFVCLFIYFIKHVLIDTLCQRCFKIPVVYYSTEKKPQLTIKFIIWKQILFLWASNIVSIFHRLKPS